MGMMFKEKADFEEALREMSANGKDLGCIEFSHICNQVRDSIDNGHFYESMLEVICYGFMLGYSSNEDSVISETGEPEETDSKEIRR